MFPISTWINGKEIGRWVLLWRKYTIAIVWISRLVCRCHVVRRTKSAAMRNQTKTARNTRWSCGAFVWRKCRQQLRLPALIRSLWFSVAHLCQKRRSKDVILPCTTEMTRMARDHLRWAQFRPMLTANKNFRNAKGSVRFVQKASLQPQKVLTKGQPRFEKSGAFDDENKKFRSNL